MNFLFDLFDNVFSVDKKEKYSNVLLLCNFNIIYGKKNIENQKFKSLVICEEHAINYY